MAVVARRPTQALIDLVGTLRGTWHGNYAMCRCPAHVDRDPSLSLRQGDRGILVTCFAGCNSADVLSELQRVQVSGHFPGPPKRPVSGGANVERLWSQAMPLMGTLGERYLASRHLLPAPGDVRYHPRCPRGARPHTVFKPALLVAVREGQRLVALQRIFLDPETAMYTEKATLGPLGLGAWRGGGIGPTLGLAEGFETARAWSLLHRLSCWASLGSRRFGLVTIPDSVSELILAGDDDLAGRRAVNRASVAYAKAGRLIRTDFPSGAKDWAGRLAAMKRGGGGEG